MAGANIFGCLRDWPKTLGDCAFLEACLAAISKRCSPLRPRLHQMAMKWPQGRQQARWATPTMRLATQCLCCRRTRTGTNVSDGYDANERLSGVTDNGPGGGATSYGYDQTNQLSSMQYPDSVAHSYGYDNRDRLINLTRLARVKHWPATRRYSVRQDESRARRKEQGALPTTPTIRFIDYSRRASAEIQLRPTTGH